MSKKNYASYKYLLLSLLLITSMQAYALNFDIVTSKTKVTIVYAKDDHKLDSIAAHLLAADIERVTGYLPKVITNISQAKGNVILIGTMGSKLIKGVNLNTSALKGKWESYCLQVVNQPYKNIAQALVITGSDIRGTSYGVFDVSERIGVSPWYWWADVPVKKRSEIYINSAAQVMDNPAVKYRGIFINDEAPAFSGWTKEKFGGVNHKVYEHMFELLLRLKGNFLWPAMWGNAFNEDDPENPRLADEYGIVMGTSHHEPMMRAQKESLSITTSNRKRKNLPTAQAMSRRAAPVKWSMISLWHRAMATSWALNRRNAFTPG